MNESYESRKMREKFTNEAAFLKQPEPKKARHRKIMGFASFLIEDLSELGEHLGRVNDISSVENLFEVNKIILSFVDFFRIPFRYLNAWVNNEPLPFKFTLLGKVIYSGVTLGLAIALLAAPVEAPILLLVLASTLFLRKIVSFANLAYKSITINKKFQKTGEELAAELIHMEAIQEAYDLETKKQAIHLEAKNEAFDLSAKTTSNKAKFKELSALLNQETQKSKQTIIKLRHDFDESKKKIITLKHNKAVLEEKIKNIKTLNVIDKVVTMNLALSYVIGFSLSFVAPPLGATMVTIAIITGATYASVRLIPSIVSFGQRLFDSIQRFRKREIIKRNDADEETNYQSSIELTDFKSHESTASLMQLMEPKTPMAAIKTKPAEEKCAQKSDQMDIHEEDSEGEREGEGEGEEEGTSESKNEHLRHKIG